MAMPMMKMNKPKYQVGDRFNAWVIVEVNFLLSTIYKLHNNVSNGLLIMDEETLERNFDISQIDKYRDISA